MLSSQFSRLKRFCRYFFLGLLHMGSRMYLPRLPEPDEITEDIDDVQEYSMVMSTVMSLPYILICDLIQRARNAPGGKALDLCCGPGLFTTLLAKEMDYADVTGVDLSQEMLQRARQNADKNQASHHVHFLQDNVSSPQVLKAKSYDLVTVLNGIHHFPSLEHVRATLQVADQVTSDQGLIVIMDPVRQKSTRLAEGYIKTAGQDYLDQQLPNFYRQFRDSVYASWTPDELWSVIPQSTRRNWVQITPFGLPTFQILVGLPVGRTSLFVNHSLPESFFAKLVPQQARMDWNLFKYSFKWGFKRLFTPSQSRKTPAKRPSDQAHDTTLPG